MPNHVTNVLIMTLGYDEDTDEPIDIGAALEPFYGNRGGYQGLFQAIHPMPEEVQGEVSGPSPPWYQWAIAEENWGTKWGAYDLQAPEFLPGDCTAAMVTFCTAWGPPSGVMAQRGVDWFLARGAESVQWVICDPYDYKTSTYAGLTTHKEHDDA